MANHLLFVDTNVLLDFYRVRRESGLTLLNELDGIHDRLITTYQVEMEFKKNRQAAILDSLKNLKNRDAIAHPAFLAESRAADILSRRVEDANRRLAAVRTRLKKVLASPTTSDPVYKVVQRLFVDDTPLNLTRKKKERQSIKRLAFRRFLLGYPPRKASDTSMGDALNWEWLIEVANATGEHIVVVTRDSDYGAEVDDRMYVNDWLIQEFRDRVSRKRQLIVHTRLSAALKLLAVKVTREAEQEEQELVQRRESLQSPLWPEVGQPGWVKHFEQLIRTTERTEPGGNVG